MRIPLNYLQASVYSALSTDPAVLAALGSGSVVDAAGDNPAYPIITIGSFTMEGDEAKPGVWAPAMEIECISAAQGYKELNGILDATAAVLCASALPASGGFKASRGHVVGVESEVDRDPAGRLVRVGRIRVQWYLWLSP